MGRGVPSKRKFGQGEQRKRNEGEVDDFPSSRRDKGVKGKKLRRGLQADMEETRKKRDTERDESNGLDEEEETEEEENEEQGSSSSESEQDVDNKGDAKLVHGSRAFKMAFMKIMRKSYQDDSVLGPVLSAHKNLVVKKLAEDLEDFKAKSDAKKARHMAGEKGHVTPATFLEPKEKFLLSVATKGVVKLFNAVNKAQNPQTGMNPSRSKDAKVLGQKRREAFHSEMKKTTTAETINPSRVSKATDSEEEPGWAPLRDSYMLTSSKVKDWDKMEQPSAARELEHNAGSGSEED